MLPDFVADPLLAQSGIYYAFSHSDLMGQGICVLLMIVFAFAAESIFRNLSILGVFLERKTGALKEKIQEKRNV